MYINLKKILFLKVAFALFFAGICTLFSPNYSHAITGGTTYTGTGIFGGCGASMDDPDEKTIECFIYSALDTVVLPIFGALIVVLAIISGILYLTSFGSPNMTSLAKKSLEGVIIGFVIVLSSRFIIGLIVDLVK